MACHQNKTVITRSTSFLVQDLSIRPYRNSPEINTEIDKQIAEMLASGIIIASKSAFSSPIIVIKKNDGGWRLCSDFRQLNALTILTKFPIPVIDELLDVLQGFLGLTCKQATTRYGWLKVKNIRRIFKHAVVSLSTKL
jgi:hypothetical protein